MTLLQHPVMSVKVADHSRGVSVRRTDLDHTNVLDLALHLELEEWAFVILADLVVLAVEFDWSLIQFVVECFEFLRVSNLPFPWTCHRNRERNEYS